MKPQNTQATMTPEEAKASLGLSTRLMHQFLQSQNPQDNTLNQQSDENPEDSQQTQPAQSTTTMEAQPETMVESTTDKTEPTEPKEDKTPEIESKLKDLESKHTSDIQDLKRMIDNDNLEAKMKKGYEKKIAELQQSHEKEMKAIKSEIKDILNT